MISELVDASAWMNPAEPLPPPPFCWPEPEAFNNGLLEPPPMPVPLWLPLVPLVVWLLFEPPLLPPLLLFKPVLLLCWLLAEASFETTARSVCASLTASAFFRYTTCTLPSSCVG